MSVFGLGSVFSWRLCVLGGRRALSLVSCVAAAARKPCGAAQSVCIFRGARLFPSRVAVSLVYSEIEREREASSLWQEDRTNVESGVRAKAGCCRRRQQRGVLLVRLLTRSPSAPLDGIYVPKRRAPARTTQALARFVNDTVGIY